jgi:hypothetical protein
MKFNAEGHNKTTAIFTGISNFTSSKQVLNGLYFVNYGYISWMGISSSI